MDLNKFKTDPALDSGTWVSLGDARLKIARLGSPRYQSAMQARLRPLREAIQRELLSDTDARKLQIETLADFILLDWEGVQDDGAPLPYSRENAIRALQIDEFRAFVVEQATNLENFRVREVKQAVEAIAKN